MIKLTEHARIRLRQRGIPAPIVDTLLNYGRVVYNHHRGRIVFFDRPSRKRLARAKGREFLRLYDGFLDCYAVVSNDDEIITVGHRYRRIRRDR